MDTPWAGAVENVPVMKRYQNPDIFEHLAMSYALGTLQGKARTRFEALMARHLYLRATTLAYQQKFNGLADLLPAQTPPARIWSRIEKQLGLHTPSRWQRLQHYLSANLSWSLPAVASVAAAALTTLFLSQPAQPEGYIATLKSTQQTDKVVVAMAAKQDMNISFEMLEQALPKDKGMTPTLWCIPKNKDEPPMRMGALATAGGQPLPISQDMWKGLQGASQFAISMEPASASGQNKPMGEIVLKGALMQVGGK